MEQNLYAGEGTQSDGIGAPVGMDIPSMSTFIWHPPVALWFWGGILTVFLWSMGVF